MRTLLFALFLVLRRGKLLLLLLPDGILARIRAQATVLFSVIFGCLALLSALRDLLAFQRDPLPQAAGRQSHQINANDDQQRDRQQNGARQTKDVSQPLADKSAKCTTACADHAVLIQQNTVCIQKAACASAFLEHVNDAG